MRSLSIGPLTLPLLRSDAMPHSGREVAGPFTIVGVEKTAPRRAPGVGEHSGAPLAANGSTAEQIAALRSAGLIACLTSAGSR